MNCIHLLVIDRYNELKHFLLVMLYSPYSKLRKCPEVDLGIAGGQT